jgi:hypothetical protein
MSLNKHNITDGEQYANILINDILLSHLENSSDNPIEDETIKYWCEEIKKASIIRYKDYIEGSVEDYRFTEEEMMELYRQAIAAMVGETLESLVGKELVTMSIDENGEIVYKATEKGKNYSKE